MDQIESSSESVRLLENKERDILYEMEQTSQEKSVVTKPSILTSFLIHFLLGILINPALPKKR